MRQKFSKELCRSKTKKGNTISSEKLETALKITVSDAQVCSLVWECFPTIFVEQVNCLFSLEEIPHFCEYLKKESKGEKGNFREVEDHLQDQS